MSWLVQSHSDWPSRVDVFLKWQKSYAHQWSKRFFSMLWKDLVSERTVGSVSRNDLLTETLMDLMSPFHPLCCAGGQRKCFLSQSDKRGSREWLLSLSLIGGRSLPHVFTRAVLGVSWLQESEWHLWLGVEFFFFFYVWQVDHAVQIVTRTVPIRSNQCYWISIRYQTISDYIRLHLIYLILTL